MSTVSIKLAVEGGKKTRDEFRGTADEVTRLDGRLGRVSSSALRAAQGLSSLAGRGLSTGIRTLATGAGVLATAVGAVAAAGATVGIKTAANMEQANIAFTTMLGSGEKAKSFLADLNVFASKTPFDFPGLTTAASSLISAGIDASKVIPIMTTLGNATSGMGTGAEGIQRATIALQQMNAAGRITGEDLNQLRDAGIPVFDLLAAATGKSKEAVAELAQAGKLGKPELEQLMGALVSGKGLERFNGLMEKQSASLSGMTATLKDTVGMGLATAFQPAIPFLKTVLTDTNTLVTRLLPGITSGVGKVTAAIAGAYEIFVRGDYNSGWWGQLGVAEDSGVIDVLFRVRDAAAAAFGYLSSAATGTDWGAVWGKITGAVGAVRDAFVTVKTALSGVDFSTLGAGLSSFGTEMTSGGAASKLLAGGAQILGGALQFLADHMDTIIKYMPAIAAGFAAWKLMQQAQILITLGGLPVRVAELGVMAAHARANAALAAQMRIANGVQQAGMLVRIKDFAIKVKDLAVITALAVRYAAWQVVIATVTAVQWLFNAAATAGGVAVRFLLGPVGLVITAIALLAAGLVYAYKHSDTFRGIVDGLWGKLKEAWGWIQGTAVPVLKIVFAAALDAAKAKFEQIRDTIGGFIGKLRDAWDWVKKLADRISDSALGKAIGAVTGVIGGGGIDGTAAAGGYMRAGETFLVGERGPELFTAGQSGQVLSHQQTLATLAPANLQMPPVSLTKDDYGLPAAGSLAGPIEITVVTELDGKVVAKTVAREFGNTMARSLG